MDDPRSAPTNAIEAAVFDWDGTLTDSKRALVATYHATSEELLGYRFPVEPEDVDRIVQLRAKEAFPLITKGDAELTERFAEAFHRHYAEQLKTVSTFAGTTETLEALRRAGVRLGVATSKARARVDLEGEHTGLLPLFDAIVTGDDVANAKPDPEPIEAAIESLGTDPARTLYVGDGPNDVIAGRAAGAITVGVSYGFHPTETRAEKPVRMIDHPSELLELLTTTGPI